MLYLLIWKCFKIWSSLLRVNGSDEKGLQGLGFKAWSMLESRSFFFPFPKKNLNVKSGSWVGLLNETIFISSNARGGCPVEEGGRMLKLQMDQCHK